MPGRRHERLPRQALHVGAAGRRAAADRGVLRDPAADRDTDRVGGAAGGSRAGGRRHRNRAVGGGGIPVVKTEHSTYEGIDAVIDKDFATSLLAEQIKAGTLVITTGVPKVSINFGTPDQKELDFISVEELKKYKEENHFPEGSMLPKIEASLNFLEASGKRVIITNPESLKDAVNKKSGTHIVKQ